MPKHRALMSMNILLWLALALRLFRLDDQSLWYDEGVTWYLTQFPLIDQVRWTAADIQPPFYYLLLWFTSQLFGESEWALRFPSVVFGLLAIPIIWQLGHTLFRPSDHRLAAYLAAIFAAAAPLMVYYSQEARMYTLLVFQASLTTYLLRQQVTERGGRGGAIAYILVMASALYTHYFAAFLLLIHGLTLLLTLPNAHNRSRLLRLGVGLMLGPIILFSPWLPVLLARLGDDPSYWPGLLKLDEIVQDVFISFSVGGKREMIFEQDGLRLAAGFGLLLLGSAVLLLKRTPHSLRLLLLWLVLPIALILLLSYQTPKFNPRYTMLAWPPFALILAGGFSTALRLGRGGKGWLRWAAWLGLLFIALSWVFSLNNWYFKESFRRDDFKSLAQFVRERSFNNEPVLLSSGHFFPVWRYYAGPDNWTPLPKMETLDINRVVNLGIRPELSRALQGQPGVWLVTWQNEVTDPNDVIPLLLDTIGQRTSDPLLIGDFIGVRLQYWHLPPGWEFPDDIPATIPADANFGQLVRLRGLRYDPASAEEVTLFWQALQPLTDDYLITLRLLDGANIPWSDAITMRPGAYRYPTRRWPPGKTISTHQAIPWLPGSPPGDYWLEVGWLASDGSGVDVLDTTGNPQRRTLRLGPLRRETLVPGLTPDHFTHPQAVGPVTLLAASFATDGVESGSKVILETIWQIDHPAALGALTPVAWIDSAGTAWELTAPGEILPPGLEAGSIVRARHKLSTPPQAAPGPAQLHLQASQPDGTPTTTILDGLTLQPTERRFTPPAALDITLGRSFANLVTLLGATTESQILQLQPGQSRPITLFWQAEAPFFADYTIFFHLLNEAGGVALNLDHPPPRPTSNWVEGEIIADAVTLTIPPDFPPGRYSIEVGLYNTADPNYARLPLSDRPVTDDAPVGQTYLILTEVEVVSP